MRAIYCTDTQERIPLEHFAQGIAVWCRGKPYVKTAALRLGLPIDPAPPAEIARQLPSIVPKPAAAPPATSPAASAKNKSSGDSQMSLADVPTHTPPLPMLKTSNLQESSPRTPAHSAPAPKKNTAIVPKAGAIFARPDESTQLLSHLADALSKMPPIGKGDSTGRVPTLPPLTDNDDDDSPAPARSASGRMKQSPDIAKMLAAESKALEEARQKTEQLGRDETERIRRSEEEAKAGMDAGVAVEADTDIDTDADVESEAEAHLKALEEAEHSKRMDEAKKRVEELARRADEARKRAEEEEQARVAAEAEFARAREAARIAAEAKKKAEDEARRIAEARKRAEEEARRIAEAKKRADEEIRAKLLAEEAKRKAEAEEIARITESKLKAEAAAAALKAEQARQAEAKREKEFEIRTPSAADIATTPRLTSIKIARELPDFEPTEIIPNLAEKMASHYKSAKIAPPGSIPEPASAARKPPAIPAPFAPAKQAGNKSVPETPKAEAVADNLPPKSDPVMGGKLKGEKLSIEAMQQYSIFQKIPSAQLALCLGAVSLHHFQKGDLICKEAERGSSAFYLLDGGADVFVSAPMTPFKSEKEKKDVSRQGALSFFRRFTTGIIPKLEVSKAASVSGLSNPAASPTYDYLIAHLNPLDLFGEMTCLSYSPRSATVRAAENCSALELLCNAVQVLHKYQKLKPSVEKAYRERALGPHLRSIPILADLDDKFIEILRDRIEFISFEPGEIILKQDDPATALYLIRSGCIKVAQPRIGGELVRGYLGRAEFFGEVGLVRSGKHTATLTALDHTEIVKIKKADFEFMLSGHDGLRERFEEQIARREKANQLIADFGFWNVCGNAGAEHSVLPPQ